jgi:SAM-dependent methyltransferase
MAEGYTRWRPPVHRHVIEKVRAELGWQLVDRALDLGCGAGLSTEPLLAMARRVTGLEPAAAMTRIAAAQYPGAAFLQGRLEELPFPPRTFPLVAAAGSLNWCDLDAVLPAIAALVADGGHFLLYDFGPGLLPGRAAEWHELFRARYPFPPARRIGPEHLPESLHGLTLTHARDFEIELVCSRDFYLEYALTETNVEAALARGAEEATIRDWCSRTLDSLLDSALFPVRFEGYWMAYRR